MTIKESYLAEIEELRRIIALIPDDNVISRITLLKRLEEVLHLLEQLSEEQSVVQLSLSLT